MVSKSFIVNKLPNTPEFGDSVTSAIRNNLLPLWFQVREQISQSQVGDQMSLLVERINKFETHPGIKGRFYIWGRTGNCPVARKGQYVHGWLDDNEGSGELIVSDEYIP